MIAFENRAAAVIFKLFKDHKMQGPVLLPANICPIVPLALMKAGQRFEFLDISPQTLCIDHDLLINRWENTIDRPSGLIYVRTYGAVEDDTAAIFNAIRTLSPSALLIDDRCACPPSFDKSSLLDGVDAVLYSTGRTKYADIGYGGYAFLAANANYPLLEFCYEPDALAAQTQQSKAAIQDGTAFIYTDNNWLDANRPPSKWQDYRRLVEAQAAKAMNLKLKINAIYRTTIPAELQLADNFQSWRFNIRVGNKTEVIRRIEEAGLFASGHYDSLAGKLGPGTGENAAAVHSEIINLFNDFYFDEARARSLASLISGSATKAS